MTPVLYARLDRSRKTVRAYCPHCQRDHVHGAAGVTDGRNPHRLAHCGDPASPFHATGYELALAITTTAEGWGNA